MQCAFGHMVYDTQGPLLQPVIRWIKRDQKRHANIIANTRDACTEHNIKPTVELWVMFNVGICLHHTLGAVTGFLSYCLGSTRLCCLALSFEIGEDVLHYLQMLQACLHPPGPEPFRTLPRVAWLGFALHHVLGLFAGTFAYLFAAHWPEVQLLTFLLLSAVLPAYISIPFQPFTDLHSRSIYGKITLFGSILGLVFMLYARFYIYLPLAYALGMRVREEFGAVAGFVVGAPHVRPLQLLLLVPERARDRGPVPRADDRTEGQGHQEGGHPVPQEHAHARHEQLHGQCRAGHG